MGPDKKDTAQLTVYMDGQPVGTAYGEIPEISLVAKEPTEATPPAVISRGSMTITLERAGEAMKSLAGAWGAICTTIEQAGKALARVWAACREALESRRPCGGPLFTTVPWPIATGTPRKSGPGRSTPSGSWPGIGRRSCKC